MPASTQGVFAPGDRIRIERPGGGWETCTGAAILAGSDGHRYVATAGHCSPQRGVLSEGQQPSVTTADGLSLGRLVWAELDSVPHADAALVRVSPDAAVETSTRVIGGPVAMRSAAPEIGSRLLLVGNAPGLASDLVPAMKARGGVVAFPQATPASFTYAAPAAPGDSGGPVVDCSGRLVGIHSGTFVGFFEDGPRPYGPQEASMLAPALERAGEALSITLELVPGTAPFAHSWCD